MRIQHNIMAMNAYRNYTNNTSALSKNLEKLSSGYKINRAGDDAAGLAISEKMRAQITGLEGAQKNAKDGISLVQTAEGALTEVHDMLNRMYSLAEQSANGTYEDATDRAQLQKEVAQLKDEINRIADATNFNGIQLLDGSLAESNVEATGTQLMDIKATGAAMSAERVDAEAAAHVFNAKDTGLTNKTNYEAFEITFKNAQGQTKTITLVEGAVAGIANDNDGANVADALSGKSNGLSLAPAGGSAEDLAEFRELFDITGVSTAGAAGNEQGVKIQAKDPASGADLVSIRVGTSNTSADAAVAALVAKAEDVTSTKAEAGGFAIDLDTAKTDGTTSSIAAGNTVKIGDTVYEFVASSGTKPTTAGATAVVVGADNAASTQNLLAQLKKDGYEVSLSNNDKTKLIFTDLSKLSEKQAGSQIEASNSDLLITKQEAAKQTTTITIGATTSQASNTLTFNYVDENGKAQSKTLTYKSAAGTQAGNAEAIVNALKNDADLVKLFDISYTANQANFTITARGTGDEAGQFTGMVLSDTAASQTITKTAGAYEGKTVELKDGNNLKAGDTITVNGKTYEFTDDTSKAVGAGNTAISLGATANDTLENLSKQLTADGVIHTLDKSGANYKLVFNDKDYTGGEGGLTLQIGDTGESFNQLTVSINDCHTKSLGIADLDIGTQEGANAALEVIENAINYISDVRGTLGATQNRLDHTINNLSVMQENIQDAESSIRDTDVADEMMDYTKNNILIQSAQAMLAQANQVPQGVLQLLQ